MIYSTEQAVYRRSKIMPKKAVFPAKALFDNEAESSRELDFRKGDTLEVVDQNPNGLRGWWLCRLNGREGLAPANRLRLLKCNAATTNAAAAGDYDVPKPMLTEKRSTSSRNHRHSNGAFSPDQSRPLWQPSDSPPSVRSYRSSGSNFSESIVFLSPPASTSGSSNSSRLSIATSDLGSSERNSAEPCGELYDILPGTAKKLFDRSPEPTKLVATAPATKETTDYDYIDADTDTPVVIVAEVVAAPESHYDCLPKRGSVLPRKTVAKSSKDLKKRESFLRGARIYDVLPRQTPRIVASREDPSAPSAAATATHAVAPAYLPNCEPLQVTKQVAVTRISLMQSQLQTELSRLFSFVSERGWRDDVGRLADTLARVKPCCESLVKHLTDLIRFLLRAALASSSNATHTADVTLEARLRGLIDAVFGNCKHIRERLLALTQQAWAPTPATVAAVEAIVATGQVLTEDVRKMTAFVLGNAQLIFSDDEEARVQTRPLPNRPGLVTAVQGDDEDHEYEDVDYGHVTAAVVPRSPTLERKILNSYIQEVNDEVRLIRPLIAGFSAGMFAEGTVTSVAAAERASAIVTRTSKLARLTESLSQTLTLQETAELRGKLRKIGGYIATACKTFNLAIRAATKTPDEEHFRGVEGSLKYLNELCQFLKNSTESEV
ncbi:hypothetical protein BV898_17147 [Hypsibius exemplaris]|uniref:SH3 domain-containing protein n=1 Tax=Hypsibius exemplaris TaxID=2072580 RepID=A0A9X6RMJ2_HYPEX|nr:hypothetical protein BV898_17147 [Hypsibius exemplaris]